MTIFLFWFLRWEITISSSGVRSTAAIAIYSRWCSSRIREAATLISQSISTYYEWCCGGSDLFQPAAAYKNKGFLHCCWDLSLFIYLLFYKNNYFGNCYKATMICTLWTRKKSVFRKQTRQLNDCKRNVIFDMYLPAPTTGDTVG